MGGASGQGCSLVEVAAVDELFFFFFAESLLEMCKIIGPMILAWSNRVWIDNVNGD